MPTPPPTDDDDRVNVPEGTDPEEFLRKLLQVDPCDNCEFSAETHDPMGRPKGQQEATQEDTEDPADLDRVAIDVEWHRQHPWAPSTSVELDDGGVGEQPDPEHYYTQFTYPWAKPTQGNDES
jgi:hypothetical protein